jgi:hypothetical protein
LSLGHAFFPSAFELVQTSRIAENNVVYP